MSIHDQDAIEGVDIGSNVGVRGLFIIRTVMSRLLENNGVWQLPFEGAPVAT
jgi:hypothetical protein